MIAVDNELLAVIFSAVPNDFLGLKYRDPFTNNDTNSSSNKWHKYPSRTEKLSASIISFGVLI